MADGGAKRRALSALRGVTKLRLITPPIKLCFERIRYQAELGSEKKPPGVKNQVVF